MKNTSLNDKAPETNVMADGVVIFWNEGSSLYYALFGYPKKKPVLYEHGGVKDQHHLEKLTAAKSFWDARTR